MSMRRPPSENELRDVCEGCGYIDYYNPKLVRSVRHHPYLPENPQLTCPCSRVQYMSYM